MTDIINILGLHTTDILDKYPKGQFRVITKNKYTGMGCHDLRDFENERACQNPAHILNYYKKGTLQSIEFRPEGSDYWFKVFSRTGKRIHQVDQKILAHLKVGTINQLWYNTELYNQAQYTAVQAKSWDSYAYRMNEAQVEPQAA